MTIEIMSFPIEHGDFPCFFVCLLEGTWDFTRKNADFTLNLDSYRIL